jgi:hypothetical protein
MKFAFLGSTPGFWGGTPGPIRTNVKVTSYRRAKYGRGGSTLLGARSGLHVPHNR